MHHGRCCYLNPGRRRREAKKAAAADGRVKPLDVPNFDNAKRDTNAPYAHAVRGSGGGSSGDVACQSLKKEVFFEAWPCISEWIKSNRNKRKGRLVERMCRRQRAHLLQVAFYRFRLDRVRERQGGWDLGDPQDPEDPYRGWDDFFWLDHVDGPRTIEEEWVLRTLRSINFHDQAVAQAEREYAERERRRLQPDSDHFGPWRLEETEDSDVDDSDSSGQDTGLQWSAHLEGLVMRVQPPAGGYWPREETHGPVANMMIDQALSWQVEAQLEADDARVASDAEWLEQTLRWHEDARRAQEERDAASDVDQERRDRNALSDEEWLESD